MNMKVLSVTQGTPEWHAARAGAFTASEAQTMMGASPYGKKRTSLLTEKLTGISEEIGQAQQEVFDSGHRVEAAFRPHAEDIIGDELWPTTGAIELDGLNLLASFDGLTASHQIGFEHKLYSASSQWLFDAVTAGQVPEEFYWQLEHQLLVSGAEKILFVCSDGTPERAAHLWYEPVPGRREKLIAGWKQFAEDLASHAPREAAAAAVGRAPETLPALRIEVTGMVTASNLDEFKRSALAVFAGISTTLETDEDFASAEKTVKWCADVEDRLAAAKQHALSQTASIDELFRAIDDIREEARQKRLQLDKLVKARKDAIRLEIVSSGQAAIAAHVAKLNARLGGQWMPNINPGLAEAIKGKRTVASLHDAVDTAIARAKIEANEIADRIEINRKALQGDPRDWMFLFPDFEKHCAQPLEVFAAFLAQRIRQYEEREQARRDAEAARLAEQAREAERRIAAEKDRVEQSHALAAEDASPVRAWAEPIEQAEREAATVTPIRAPAPAPAEDLVEKFLASREWKSAAAKKNAGALLREFVEFTTINRRASAGA